MKNLFYHLGYFKWTLAVLVASLALAFAMRGPALAVVVAVLVILEVSLSFDNAVINATILARMNAFWQKMFLTLGILIAVFGMRLVFPIAIVAVTAGLDWGTVVDLVLNHPEEYGHKLHEAHPSIAAFGGMFLFMIFLDFVIDESKRTHWFSVIERPLAKAGRLKTLSTLMALTCLLIVVSTLHHDEAARVLLAGVVGQVTYLFVRGFSQLFEQLGGVEAEHGHAHEQLKPAKSGHGPVMQLAGRAAFFLFLYLEVLDASFSFDGVVGAFAITNDVLTIALGLGVGALAVRSLTVWLVRHDTLKEFVYLEHGAHYAVGALAVLLAVSLHFEIPEVVTGLIGVGFIVWAFFSSLAHRNRMAQA